MTRSRSLTTIFLIIAGLCISAQIWNLVNWGNLNNAASVNPLRSEFSSSTQQINDLGRPASKRTLFSQTEALTERIDLLITRLVQCNLMDCQLSQSELLATRNQLASFLSVASQEKSGVNLVGTTEYPQLQLALDKYADQPDANALLATLYPIYTQLQATQNTLIASQAQTLNATQSQIHTANLVINGITIASLLLALVLYNRKLRKLGKEYNLENRQFSQLAEQIHSLDSQKLNTIVSNLSVPPNERTIYSHLLRLHNLLENEKNQSDLYRQLYSMIGFEIRGIANTIQGGVKLLTHEGDEKADAMTKEIASATGTLTELADNYNKLITQGSDESSQTSLLALLSDLLVHIKSKAQRHDIAIECIFDDNIPDNVEQSSTELFWVLFLQLSNSLSLIECQKVVLRFSARSSQQVDQSTVVVDLIYLTADDISLNELHDAHWKVSEEQRNASDNWSQKILGESCNFASSWFVYGSLQKKRLEFDITPVSFYQAGNQLRQKSVLLCADSILQIDIVQTVLEREQCKVTVARSPNEVFTYLIASSQSRYDAILVTDTIKGIELHSFCKTIKSRLSNHPSTQLLLAVSEATAVVPTLEVVNGVFYTPVLPHEFIPNLINALDKPSQQSDSEQSQFLIVEDDRAQQIVLGHLLKKQGHNAHAVSSGTDAVEFVKNHPIDIVFMDCIMPGISGLDATKLIRSFENDHPERKPLTIIGATALTSADVHKSCIEAGMDFVIPKPYKSEEIAKVVKKYLAVHKVY